MTRNLLILALLAAGAAGAAQADPAGAPTSVVVNLRGLSPVGVNMALHRAVLSVCNTGLDVDSADCYDATMAVTREKLQKLRHAEAAAEAPTTLATR